MKKIIYLLYITVLMISSSVKAQTPITCSDTAFFFQGTTVTDLYGINLGLGTYTLLKSALIPSPPNQVMNAFGYNRLDNFLWGHRDYTNEIVQIGSSPYNVITYPVSGLPSNKNFNTGDVDSNGVLYLYAISDTVIYRINLSNQQLLSNIDTKSSRISDWVFSPIDGNLYSVDSLHSVFRFHPATGQRDSLGQATGNGMTTTSPFGAQFMDSLGNLFISDNLSGKIFEIAAPHNGNTAAVLFSQGPAAIVNDGAFCRGAMVTSIFNIPLNDYLSVSLYPNPAEKELVVKAGTNELLEFILYDIASRKLLQQLFRNTASMNIEQLAKGIYIYEVRNKNGMIKKGKVVKE